MPYFQANTENIFALQFVSTEKPLFDFEHFWVMGAVSWYRINEHHY
jgi:hypothetical protein